MPSRPPRVLLAASVILALATACKKEAPVAAPPAPVETGIKEVELNLDQKPAGTLSPPIFDPKGMPDQDFIYNTTARFLLEQKRPAKDLEELIATGYMPKLPPPPPGKKYVLNQRAAMIQLVDASKK